MSSTTGTAPESHATESSRSRRRRLGGSAIGWTTNTVSMLAASTCTSEVPPGSARVMALARGSTASMRGEPAWSPVASTATQSPTAGNSVRERASCRLRVDETLRCGYQDTAAVTPDDAGGGKTPRGVGFKELLPVGGVAERSERG